MSDTIQVGSIITGKVTGIQPYGAFVALNEKTQGLVHISEITHGYVRNINDYIKVGEEIKVKVLSVDEEAGKIGLSIRAIEESAHQDSSHPHKNNKRKGNIVVEKEAELSQGFNTLKEKLEEWIDQSKSEDIYQK